MPVDHNSNLNGLELQPKIRTGDNWIFSLVPIAFFSLLLPAMMELTPALRFMAKAFFVGQMIVGGVLCWYRFMLNKNFRSKLDPENTELIRLPNNHVTIRSGVVIGIISVTAVACCLIPTRSIVREKLPSVSGTFERIEVQGTRRSDRKLIVVSDQDGPDSYYTSVNKTNRIARLKPKTPVRLLVSQPGGHEIAEFYAGDEPILTLSEFEWDTKTFGIKMGGMMLFYLIFYICISTPKPQLTLPLPTGK